jgi:hypothetical protein
MRDPAAPKEAGSAELVKNSVTAEKNRERESVTPPAAGSRTRYTLTASLPSGGADGLVTFADLRSALRKRREPARTVALDLQTSDRNAMWDVYKSRF